LRVEGPGHVDWGDNPVDNRGVINIRSGTLHLHHTSHRYTQRATGSLRVASQAELRSDRPLELAAGDVRGSGTIAADVIQHGTTRPGEDAVLGVLRIAGTYRHQRSAALEVRLIGDGSSYRHDGLAVTGKAALFGTLQVYPSGPTPADGTSAGVLSAALLDGDFRRVRGTAIDGQRSLDLEWTDDALALTVAPVKGIWLFYGFSGSQRLPVPSWPDGVDHDRSLEMTAQTMAKSLGGLFPSDRIRVHQAWTKDTILTNLEAALEPIRQVHIFTHGVAPGLFLAYAYGGGARLKERAVRYNQGPGTDEQRALAALLEEDALLTGLLTRALPSNRVDAIKARHAPGAVWQIWGCRSGVSNARFEGDDDPDLDAYFKRFNFDATIANPLPGVARNIADALDVICTAAAGPDEQGLNFWVAPRPDEVRPASTQDPAQPPFWLWNTSGAKWVSYGAAGLPMNETVMLGRVRRPDALVPPKPPDWLTGLFWD
jgi:hypothetical protein